MRARGPHLRIIVRLKFTNITNISVRKTTFFPRLAIAKILFVLDSTYNGDTPYRVWLDLNDSLTR